MHSIKVNIEMELSNEADEVMIHLKIDIKIIYNR